MMASSFWSEDRYSTHFFCALCGGPFARVYRTDEPYKDPKNRRPSARRGRKRARSSQFSNPDRLYHTTIEASGEEEPSAFRHSADDARIAKKARNAYPGRDVKEQDLKWTRIIRALVHKYAQVQPEGGQEQAEEEQDVYLTGRGRVREDASWADAHPSIQDDLEDENDTAEEDEDDVPIFRDDFSRFHMYQEPGRNDRKYLISSIPFHEECWDIMLQALHHSRAIRNLPDLPIGKMVDLDVIWSYLVNLIPTAVDGRLSDLTVDAMTRGIAGDYVRRLSIGCMGNGGYREAQPYGASAQWEHVEGQHWLVVNPERTALARNPFEPSPIRRQPPWTRSQTAGSIKNYLSRATKDPFWALPAEVLVDIVDHLTCKETFRWRSVSVPLNLIAIPHRVYRRFTKHEMAFMPTFIKQLEIAEASEDRTEIHWKRVFEQASTEWRNHDGLRNRRRIWKIIQPMAEELIESSPQSLRRLGCPSHPVARAISVTRGSVGLTSGAEGHRATALFASAGYSLEKADDGSTPTSTGHSTGPSSTTSADDYRSCAPRDLTRALRTMDVWLDPQEHHVRGFELTFAPDMDPPPREGTIIRRQFGTRTAEHQRFVVTNSGSILTGFNVSWYLGSLRGIQCVFESAARQPSEYAEGEFCSPDYGTWHGPKRRLVAPRSYRHLAGVTGFVNTQGDIETFSILEEKITLPSHDGEGFLIPPDTVPLSHQEASMWRCIPPNDVDLLERQGPVIDEWKLRAAEHKIFARPPLDDETMRLESILIYAREDFVCGLEFWYCDMQGAFTRQSFGTCTGKQESRLQFGPGDEVTAVVMSHGPGGIHSLQLITPSKIGPAAGARYLGIQTVYAQDPVFPRGKDRLGHLSYLSTPVIGLHWLYSASHRRFTQLGVITRPEPLTLETPTLSAFATPAYTSSPPPASESIPLLDTDELRNPWVDGPPPPSFIRGRKDSDSLKVIESPLDAAFAGWVDLRHAVRETVVYGNMEGIRVRYQDDSQPDRYFGHTGRGSSSQVFHIEGRGKRISRVARRCSGLEVQNKPDDSLTSIMLLHNDDAVPQGFQLEVDSEYLVGLQVSFSSDRIIDWQPLYDLSDAPRGRKPHMKGKSLHLRDHWKSFSVAHSRPTAELDSTVLGKYRLLVDFFDDHQDCARVDGVRGYTLHSRFCGIRFRRQGLWDEEPLGQASSYESEFLLHDGEEFTSLFITETEHLGRGGALSLCTSLGRSTPWIGNSLSGKAALKTAPVGRRVVGIYMAFSQPDRCDTIGIIHDEARRHGKPRTVTKSAPLPPCEISRRDTETDMDWATDPKHLPADYHLLSDLIPCHGHNSLTTLSRAYSLFDPKHLQQIDPYVNQVPGRFGLKALRLRGDRRMGTVLLGDWQSQNAGPSEGYAMQISSARGERILKAVVLFHESPQYGNLIIGLHIITNWDRAHDLVRWKAFTDEEPPAVEVHSKKISCADDEEIVGFHYVVGLYVHDIGLITRRRVI